MDLRSKVEKLLTVPDLPRHEQQMLQFVLDTVGDGPLEGLMFPENEAHVHARYEWFFDSAGRRRTR